MPEPGWKRDETGAGSHTSFRASEPLFPLTRSLAPFCATTCDSLAPPHSPSFVVARARVAFAPFASPATLRCAATDSPHALTRLPRRVVVTAFVHRIPHCGRILLALPCCLFFCFFFFSLPSFLPFCLSSFPPPSLSILFSLICFLTVHTSSARPPRVVSLALPLCCTRTISNLMMLQASVVHDQCHSCCQHLLLLLLPLLVLLLSLPLKLLFSSSTVLCDRCNCFEFLFESISSATRRFLQCYEEMRCLATTHGRACPFSEPPNHHWWLGCPRLDGVELRPEIPKR